MSDKSFRTESDTMGPVEVASDAYWGAQAQRSLSMLTSEAELEE